MSDFLRPGQGRRPGGPRGNPARGLLLLAYGNPEGLTFFGADTHAYLASLAPLVGFLLVYGGQMMITGSPVRGAAAFLENLVILLAPPVLADLLCRRWNRVGEWGLYANILNWANVLLLGVAVVVAVIVVGLSAAGVPLNVALAAAIFAFLIYGTWLQWFTARCTLNITRWQTVKLLLLTQCGTAVLLVVPALFGTSLSH